MPKPFSLTKLQPDPNFEHSFYRYKRMIQISVIYSIDYTQYTTITIKVVTLILQHLQIQFKRRLVSSLSKCQPEESSLSFLEAEPLSGSLLPSGLQDVDGTGTLVSVPDTEMTLLKLFVLTLLEISRLSSIIECVLVSPLVDTSSVVTMEGEVTVLSS